MALTAEQQFQIDLEATRHANQMAMQAKQAKLETVRLAKEILIENARSKPVDSRDVTSDSVTAFAAALEAHVNT